MMALLVFREKLRSFYGRYDRYLTVVFKFALVFASVGLLNSNIGYMARLKNPLVLAGLSLVCAFLPYGAASLVVGLVMLAHIGSVSPEMAMILAVFLLIIGILYYGFQPGDSYLLLLTPIFFYLKIPYAIPLLVGLSGGIVRIIPVSCGVFVYYVLQYVRQNAGILTNDASADVIQKYVQIIRNMLMNPSMLVMVAACAVGILVVYLIRTMSVDYAWHIAIVVGTLAQMAVVFVGDFVFDVSASMVGLLVGSLVSVAIAAVYNFLVFAVDYSRTEYLRFEDDDYCYFVKAVPKIAVSAPDVKVKKINSTRNRRERGERPAKNEGL